MKPDTFPRIHWPREGVAVRVPPRRLAADSPACEVIGFAASVAQAPRAVAWDGLATAFPRGARVVLLVAAEDVSFVDAEVPNLTGLRLREALPNLVEEKIVGEAGTLHVALGRREATGGRMRTLAVVDRAWLASIQVHVVRAGHRVAAILPESLATPLQAGDWTLSAAGRGGDGEPPLRCWLRSGDQQALAIPDDPEGAVAVVASMVRAATDERRPQRIDLYAPPGAKASLKVAGEAIARATGLPLHEAGGDPFTEWLAGQGPEGGYGPPLSLLSSDGGGEGRAAWGRWRVAAFLAACLVAVQVAALQWEWTSLRGEARTLRDGQARLLTAAFPETRVVLDAPLQMSRGLATLRATAGNSDPGDFAAMVATVGRVFGALPANALRGLDYDARALRLRFAPGMVGVDQQQNFVAQARQEGYALRFESGSGATQETVATLRSGAAGREGR